MTPIDIGFLEYKAIINLYAVQIYICPYTKEPDIMALLDPLFDDYIFIIRCDEVIFATKVPAPGMPLNQLPNYVVIMTEEEVFLDVVMEGLANAEIFGVRCSPVKIGARYPFPQLPLLSFPALHPDDEMRNPDDMVIILWEECPRHK